MRMFGAGSASARRIVKRLLAIFLLGLLLWASGLAYRSLGVYRHGRVTRALARVVWQTRDDQGLFSADAARDLRVAVERFEADLGGLRSLIGPVACPVARQSFWPLARDYATLGCDGLELAVDLAALAWWSVLEMESAADQFGQVSIAPGVPLEIRDDPLQQAVNRLGRHRQRLLSLRPIAVQLSQSARDLPGLPSGARRLADLAPMAIDGLLLAPELLGGDQQRVYLVIVQNSDELRPTGGFISSVVVLRFQGYRLISLDYMNSYDVETEQFVMPPPPEPLGTYMGLGGLVFRDANWSPDFPTSAQVLASMYQANRNERVDGVFAVDTLLLQLVLEALGPLPVDSYDVTITAENLLQTAEFFWETPQQGSPLAERDIDFHGWLQHRKDFGAAFIEAGMSRLERLSAVEWLQLASALAQGLQRKHLQVWGLESPQAQHDLTHSGWTGGISTAPGDYVMVVDANLGYNKVDRHIDRAIEYTVSLATDVPQATLRLTYHNRSDAQIEACVHEARVLESYEALTQQCYWNYVRVLVPAGADLLEVEGTEHPVDQGTEKGRTVFGTLIIVPPGETHTVQMTYQLPDILDCEQSTCDYTLTVQKQSGTEAVPLVLHADVAPSSRTAPGWHAGTTLWPLVTQLETDRSLTWRFSLE